MSLQSLLSVNTLTALGDVPSLIRLAAVIVLHNVVGQLWYGVIFRNVFVAVTFGSQEALDKFNKSKENKQAMSDAAKRGIIGSLISAAILAVLLVTAFRELKVVTLEQALVVGTIVTLIMASNSLLHCFWDRKSVGYVVFNETFNAVLLAIDVVALHYIRVLGF